MKKSLSQNSDVCLLDDKLTVKKLKLNFKKNKEQDQTDHLDKCAEDFKFSDCSDKYWNPAELSLLYATPLWNESTEEQKLRLNQLYWVAYYSQIISAEIATIFLNQTASAGLYGLEDFRLVCETLDLESMQERAHIDVFKKISEDVEAELFGDRLFSYSMRPYYNETMIFQNTNRIKAFWKRIQLQAYSLLSSSNAFIGCQYLTVRGLRTLNGKMIQHKLSQFSLDGNNHDELPIPSRVSYHHFLDESYHFNSSNIIGSEVVKSLKKPTAFESFVANLGIKGSLRDHSQFSISVNGIFWYEPALFPTILKLLQTPIFGMDKKEAMQMIERCFCKENEAIHLSFKTHQTAKDSYINYLEQLEYVNKENKMGGAMRHTSIEGYLKQNQKEFERFKKKAA
jgi:hypothetical protein